MQRTGWEGIRTSTACVGPRQLAKLPEERAAMTGSNFGRTSRRCEGGRRPNPTTVSTIGSSGKGKPKLEAIGPLPSATKLKPDSADYHNTRGVALFNQWKMAEAEDAYRTAIKLKPDLKQRRLL